MSELEKRNEDLCSRLLNWKFESALKYLDGEPDEVVKLVDSLSTMFGDSGWFSGSMAILIANALENIGVRE